MFQRNAFLFCQHRQQFGFALAINNDTFHFASHFAINNIQFVGVDVINAEFGLQIATEVIKSAR